ncbi:MAG: invasion associated locus B family protein [Pseudomonadota bacterium]
MRNLIGLQALAVSLVMSAAAIAQTTDETEAPEAPVAEGEVTEDGGSPGLSMGTEDTVQDGPYVRDTFGAWELRCVRAAEDAEICQLYQLMRDGEGNSVAEFNMFPLPEGQQAEAGANIVTPLETLLTASLRLAVDQGQAKRYPFSFCSQVGCFSRIGLTAEEVAAFRAGATATVTIVPAAAPNETVELTLSLSGFTAGYNALVEVENARLSAEEE